MPYLNGKPWPRVPVIAYVETKSNVWVHPSDPKHFPVVREITEEDTDSTTVVMNFPDGSVLKTYNHQVLSPPRCRVLRRLQQRRNSGFHGDQTGFRLRHPGEYCIGMFAFSEGKTKRYRFPRLWAMGLGPHSLGGVS